ncbi:7149_t:CDS:2, partial [Racocetra persica]
KQILLLHPAMLRLAISLQYKPDAISKQEDEKLLKLCLTTEERDILKNKFMPINEKEESLES